MFINQKLYLHPEFLEPRRYEIPDKWLDPKDNTEISFTNTEKKYLIIKSSEKICRKVDLKTDLFIEQTF